MNKIFKYFLNNIKLILFFIIFFIIFFTIQNRRITNLRNDIVNQIKLKNALLDTISTYRNKNNELVSEKLTMQETINNLNEISGQLNSMQKELISRINNLDVIAAALIETNVKIDSFLHKGETIVDTLSNKIIFKDYYNEENKTLKYKFTVYDVKPIGLTKTPFLLIDSLYFPNKQYIDFKWKDDKKSGYPVSFSITNSNDFFKTENIESYIIPNITKEHLNPNRWQKFQNFYYKNKNSVIYISVGVGAGVLGTLLICK